MAAKFSLGLRNYLAITGSIKAALDGGTLKFYDGEEPATADSAVTGTLLWTVSLGGNGTGLVFDTVAVNGSLLKPSAATWQGPTAAGVPTYWRFVKSDDTGELSTTDIRIQGSCGNTAGADIFLTNPVLVLDTDLDAKQINAFAIGTLPTA